MMSYDLDEASVRRLVANALNDRPETGSRFLALAVGAATPLSEVARTVERQVFEETFGMDAATMSAEYARYEDDSMFFLVLDRKTGLPAGAARVIDGGGKTLDDAPAHIGYDLDTITAVHHMRAGRIWDFATLAVLPAYRGGRNGLSVSALLYRTFLNAGRLAGVHHVVAMLDSRAHRNLKLIGVEFAPMCGADPFEYLGSPATEALYVAFADLTPQIARQADRLRKLGVDRSAPGDTGPNSAGPNSAGPNSAGPSSAGQTGTGLRGLVTRRIAARVADQVSSGNGLDEHIMLPALDRRRLIRQS